MFIAHYIAGWLGIPAGVVIAGLIILRKKGIALRASREHQRVSRQLVSEQPAVGQESGRQLRPGR